MRLYSRFDITSIKDPETGEQYDADETGAIEVPEAFGRFLHGQHMAGKQAWEDDAERFDRLTAEEDARRRDPASLYDLLQQRLAPAEKADPLTALADAAAAAHAAGVDLAEAFAHITEALDEQGSEQTGQQPPAPAKKAPAKKAAPRKPAAQ
ncbi:MAG: hypothetical protein ACTHMS_13280 [Jatrophihabitans sp.]|uniref:hypothetical protein n=1 Tax=Jatrophihabitans sp. TaxID=1932789 RepID=UPI003F7DC6B3